MAKVVSKTPGNRCDAGIHPVKPAGSSSTDAVGHAHTLGIEWNDEPILKDWHLGEALRGAAQEAKFRGLDLGSTEDAKDIIIDSYWEEGSFEVEAEIPGVKLHDIEVNIKGVVLTIKAHVRHLPLSDSPKTMYDNYERERGLFVTGVEIPDFVDGYKAEATYLDGVLYISIPEKELVSEPIINVPVS